ncbi:unnamed protein product [Anisakis simplex]|uniref:Post-GPI attachment to proteins factor 3 n=1 Tax=Anisakis simplex TaxID=6269 RepID=A0A0M3K8F8_ANISI|nr:unnamed protein product [Anisakis simplex]
MYIILIISLTIVTSQIRAINASPGDQNGFFIKCISECSSQIGCPLATSGRIEWIFEPCYRIASTVFHWADFWLTEYLDYFSAFALIVYAFFTSLSFTLPFLQKTTYGRFVLVHLDYGYNMRCCVVFWILTATIYSCWMVREWRTRELSADRRSISYLAKFIAGGLASALFEVFDFAPILWLFDAHSLFHLATVPLPYYLIKFLRLECEYEMNWFDRHIKIT